MNWKKDGTDETLSRVAALHKLPAPKTITEHPTVEQYDLFYWECFMDLCGSRPVGQGMGYIPWTAINDWAVRYKVVDPDSFEILRFVVGKMDTFWLEFFRQKTKPFTPKSRGSKKRR